MTGRPRPPQRFPIRRVGDGDCEVLIAAENFWLTCESEEDARVVAQAPVLQYEVLNELRSGAEFAEELARTARVLAKYRIGSASRFFRRQAEEMLRKERAPDGTP